jgi:ribosomal protein S18 acetylase RimI-like enzyme
MEDHEKARKLRKLSFIEKQEALRRFSRKTWTTESKIHLRELHDTDRRGIQEILAEVKNFTPEEIGVAMSLIDETLHGSPAYHFLLAADENDTTLGYICYGHTPMTSGTWDVYWIAVSKRFQRRHIGTLLLREAERKIHTEGGRLILIDTSTKPSYHATARFYQQMGYRVIARIAKFYSENDDKLIFGKFLRS